MPAWCAYRDAARKEQVAADAATAAAALPPQAPEFQNAHLKVFGDHDEGTLGAGRA
jgi:tRNA-splicing ligase RtcB